MKKKSLTLAVAATLAASMTFSSCIGSFGLTNKLLSWNQSINSKFVNELVFIAFHIIPVYEITILSDILVLNSIEFWSGNSPVADAGKTQNVETENGIYTVEVYNSQEESWSVKSNGEMHKLLKFDGANDVVMYLPNGQEMNVELSQAGVLAFQEVAQNYTFYAAR